MSRKIKFRAWVNDHWTDFIPVAKTLGIYSESVIDVDGYTYEKENPFIVEQFTGLLDRNGKEIYEGDIIEEDIDFNSKMTDGTFRYKVYWNEDELCWSLDPIGPESIHNDLWELNSSCRVVGNIHENPELPHDSLHDPYGPIGEENIGGESRRM